MPSDSHLHYAHHTAMAAHHQAISDQHKQMAAYHGRATTGASLVPGQESADAEQPAAPAAEHQAEGDKVGLPEPKDVRATKPERASASGKLRARLGR